MVTGPSEDGDTAPATANNRILIGTHADAVDYEPVTRKSALGAISVSVVGNHHIHSAKGTVMIEPFWLFSKMK